MQTANYKIGDHTFRSRLIVGTGKYSSFQLMQDAIAASGAEMVTVAIRRMKLDGAPEENLLNYLDRRRYTLLPNTAGCYTVKDALFTAHLARELLNTPLIKIEVIGDERTLFPDNEGLLEASRQLVKDGFTVLPYCSDDPIVCKKLTDIGCAAVMPLAAPIGSGLGVRNPHNLRIIRETVRIPLIVDAGVGQASDAAVAMEIGCDAVLMNTAIAGAKDPVKMANAMRLAVEAGRASYEAGRIPKKLYATASSPVDECVRGG
ncbi:MAG: thiazole synthase [Deltaproteobacteria bacterium]|nr:thiazole synthase [Deltaproteobacteria bacterium]